MKSRSRSAPTRSHASSSTSGSAEASRCSMSTWRGLVCIGPMSCRKKGGPRGPPSGAAPGDGVRLKDVMSSIERRRTSGLAGTGALRGLYRGRVESGGSSGRVRLPGRVRGWRARIWRGPEAGRGGRHFGTSSREGLLGYFARRHRHGERLRLEEVDVGYDRGRGLGHIAYRIDRRADDLRRLDITGTTAHGKGAVDCKTGEIVVWSMGMAPGRGHPPFKICPPPRKPSRAIVACARRG